jgi:hypothetical protein
MEESEINSMLCELEIIDESVVSRYQNRDAGNYTNDHSPIDMDEAIKKIKLFIEFGGKVKLFSDHVQVKWRAHSEGELVVYRISPETYFAHGWIEVG